MFRRIAYLFEYVFRRRRLEDELDEELRSSFELMVDQFVSSGMRPDEARRAARLEFEGLDQVKERVRDSFVGSVIQTFFQDLLYAWRGLRRSRSFAVVSLLTLALGIGVNTAVFSVFYAVLMRPLPYGTPEQLVLIWSNYRSAGTGRKTLSGQIFGEIERRNRSLAGVAGLSGSGTDTVTGGNPELVKNASVTSNFFDVLGVRATTGRTFAKGEEAGPVVVTDGFFRRRFNGDLSRIGENLAFLNWNQTVVGVLPRDFRLHFAPDATLPTDVEVFAPFAYDIYPWSPSTHYLRTVARLKPGVSIAQAQQDLDRVASEIRSQYPEFASENLRFTLVGMQSDAFRDIQPALAALFAGAAFVLLICCVNVTSLLLARASDRRKEIALCLALGASRGRILRQLLAEGLVLCMLGGAAGIAVGWSGFRVLLAIRPERLSGILVGSNAGLMWPAVAFACGASLLVAIIFGIAPALQGLRPNSIETLRTGNRSWFGRINRRFGRALVVAEIALGFVLVTCAILAARTLASIERVRPGFEPRQLLTFQLSFGWRLNPDIPLSAISNWEAQFAALPGVERVGATTHLPLDDFSNWYMPYRPEGTTEAQASTMVADYRAVTPGYLPAMGVRLLEGRHFDQRDTAEARPVVIVDELLARAAWPGQSAIGKKIDAAHVIQGDFVSILSEVVGVAEHVRNHSLTKEVRAEIYVPWEQSTRSPLTFVLRTRGDPLSIVPAIRNVLRKSAPNLAMAKVMPMTEYLARDMAPAGFTAILAAVFGGLALLLAATGIYGVLNYQVSRRLPEMGIRMALGAGMHDVFRLVLGEGLALAIGGVALGAAATLGAARWLGALLYGVSAYDPLSYSLALLSLPAAALLGCWRPASRAAAASPAQIIREG
jgi:putative ABC transport system permease protein